jgi:electron transport complex protein RnfG
MRNNYIIQAWLVLFLASGFGAALAGIQLNLSPKIEANKLNETLEKVPELVLGASGALKMSEDNQSLEIDRRMVETGKDSRKKVYSVFQAKKDGQTVGWVAKASGQGYADKIELLVGVDAKVKNITGLFILDQKETPGLGSKIADWDWRKQFLDKKTEQHLIPVKSGASAPNEIDAITGATISSKFVCDIINKSLSDLKEPLTTPSK